MYNPQKNVPTGTYCKMQAFEVERKHLELPQYPTKGPYQNSVRFLSLLLLLSGCAPRILSQNLFPTADPKLLPRKIPQHCHALVSAWDGNSNIGFHLLDRMSPNGNHGTLSPSTRIVDEGRHTALHFNGLSSTVLIPHQEHLNLTQEITVSAWVKSELGSRNANTTQTILSKWGYQPESIGSSSLWSQVDISQLLGPEYGNMSNSAYNVTDGRYIYFVPGSSFMARYDTHSPYQSPASWEGIDIAGPLALKDARYRKNAFGSALFDGRYIYFIPGMAGQGLLARYDTQGPLDSPESWKGIETYGSQALQNVRYQAFSKGTLDERYIYLPSAQGGWIARYDTQGDLDQPTSWTAVDVTSHQALGDENYQNFSNSINTGRYIYFIPAHRFLARYDTQSPFTSPSSWMGQDIASTSATGTDAIHDTYGSIFDGRYLYIGTSYHTSAYQGMVERGGWLTRYDTLGPLSSNSSWSSIEFASFLNQKNYYRNFFYTMAFDGRYLYTGDPNLFRYDTQQEFQSTLAWSVAPLTSVSGLTYFDTATFDGRYLHFAATGFTSVSRYDTLGTSASYALDYSNALNNPNNGTSAGIQYTLQTTDGPMKIQSGLRSPTADKTWQHVATTYNGYELKLYLNGTLINTQPASGLIQSSSSNVTLGGLTQGKGFFSGWMDDVQIYSEALTGSMIQELYSTPGSGCSGLMIDPYGHHKEP